MRCIGYWRLETQRRFEHDERENTDRYVHIYRSVSYCRSCAAKLWIDTHKSTTASWHSLPAIHPQTAPPSLQPKLPDRGSFVWPYGGDTGPYRLYDQLLPDTWNVPDTYQYSHMMIGVKDINEPPPTPVKARLINSLLISARPSFSHRGIRSHMCMLLEDPETAEKTPINSTAVYTSGVRPTISDRRPLIGVMIV